MAIQCITAIYSSHPIPDRPATKNITNIHQQYPLDTVQSTDHGVREFPGRLAGYDVLMSPDPMEPPMVKMSRFRWLKERLPQDVSGQQIGL